MPRRAWRRSFNLVSCCQLTLSLRRCDLPVGFDRADRPTYLVLQEAGFAMPVLSPIPRCALTSTISPLPVPLGAIGCIFSVALSLGSPRVAVSHRLALSCPDFPLAEKTASDRPTHSGSYYTIWRYCLVVKFWSILRKTFFICLL